MNVGLGPLRIDDIPRACRLLRESLPEREYTRTIFACSGYSEYLRASCRCGSHAATLLIGAYAGEELIGFAEWRRLEQMLVLNNLNVDTACRSQGIGARLVAYGEELARKEGVRTLALDVFYWNERVHEWYKRLGFTEAGRTYWYEGNRFIDTASDAEAGGDQVPDFIVDEYPVAEAHHAAYGFSSFKIRTKHGTVQVGRLGEQYYRIQTQKADWDWDGDLSRVLGHLEAERKLLVLSPDAQLSERDRRLTPISESVRMIRMLENQAVLNSEY